MSCCNVSFFHLSVCLFVCLILLCLSNIIQVSNPLRMWNPKRLHKCVFLSRLEADTDNCCLCVWCINNYCHYHSVSDGMEVSLPFQCSETFSPLCCASLFSCCTLRLICLDTQRRYQSWATMPTQRNLSPAPPLLQELSSTSGYGHGPKRKATWDPSPTLSWIPGTTGGTVIQMESTGWVLILGPERAIARLE